MCMFKMLNKWVKEIFAFQNYYTIPYQEQDRQSYHEETSLDCPDCHRWMSAAVDVRTTVLDNAAVPGPGLSRPSFYAEGAVHCPLPGLGALIRPQLPAVSGPGGAGGCVSLESLGLSCEAAPGPGWEGRCWAEMWSRGWCDTFVTQRDS